MIKLKEDYMSYKFVIALVFVLFSSFFMSAENNLIFVEGEDALVTNFASEPIFNFSCSNLLTLQLNKRTESNSELKYFADYIIDVPEDGTYELWIAGTPPGNASSRMTSYFSPYELQIDNDKSIDIYYEDVEVKEKYASGYYWTKVTTLKLSPGPHTIKFVVKARRNYDNLYYFYLDAFFLIRTNQQNEYMFPEKLPAFFPKDITGKKRITFKTPEDYLSLLKDDPDNLELLDMLSEIYTLTYQYNESIKYLKTAQIIDPANMDIKRLIAQNYLWKGDFNSGINIFNSIINEQPKNISLYKETAKITSWYGIYNEAIKIYNDAISLFPDDLELKINLAITYYWDNNSDKANEILKSIEIKAQKDNEIYVSAGDVFVKNRYYDLALQFYNNAINARSVNPRPYLEAARIYEVLGKTKDAEDVLNRLKNIYPDQNEYEKIVSEYRNKNYLKIEFTRRLEEKMKNNPGDYETLILLAEVYAWQHNDKKAIEQYLKIIENKTFNAFENLEAENLDMTDILSLSEIYTNLINSYYRDYQTTLAGMDRLLSGMSKLQEGTEAYGAQLNKIQTLSDRLSAISDIFGKINENINRYAGVVDSKIQSNKMSNDIFKSKAKELKWEFNDADYRNIFEDNYKNYSSYLSLKILGVLYYFENDVRFTDTASKLYDNFQDEKKTRYQYYLNMAGESTIGDIVSFLDNNRYDIVQYNPDIQNVYDELQSYVLDDTNENQFTGDLNVLREKYSEYKSQSDSITSLLKENINEINGNMSLIKSYLRDELAKRVFNFENEISGLRLELGQYYSNIKEYDKADFELNSVLKVDRDNLDVKFLLAKNYQVRGDWYRAMTYFREVFQNDPRNTMSASLYNQLADQNPNTISSLSKYYTENNVRTDETNQSYSYFNEVIELNLFINSFISCDIKTVYYNYLLNNISIGNKTVPYFSISERFNSFNIGTAFNFEIMDTGLVFSPSIGLDYINLFQLNCSSNQFARPQNSYINNYFFYPDISFKFQWKKIPYFNVIFDYDLGIVKEAIVPGVDGYYFSSRRYLDAKGFNSQYQVYLASHQFDLALNYNFKFTRIYPFTKISMSTKISFDIYALSDIRALFDYSKSPFKYTINQDFYFNFAEIIKAGLKFNLIGLFIYEGSDKDFYENYNYTSNQPEDYFGRIYTPRQNITGKWGLSIKFETAAFSKAPLSFNTQVLVGAQWQEYDQEKNYDKKATETYVRKTEIPFLLVNIDNSIEIWLKRLILVFEFGYSLSYDINGIKEFNDVIYPENVSHFQSFNGSIYIKIPIHENLKY